VLKDVWTLSAGSKVRGGGWSLNRAQTKWADYVAHLGLERGVDTSELEKEARKAHRDAKHPKSTMLEKRRREQHEAAMAEAQAQLDLGNDLVARGQKLIAEAAAKGQDEADRIIGEAEAKALQIVIAASQPIADAQAKAARIKADANEVAEREAKAITDGAEARVQAAIREAVAAAEAKTKAEAEAKAKEITDAAEAAAKTMREEALAWAQEETGLVEAAKVEAVEAKAEAKKAKKALDDERDAILQAARDEAATIKENATKSLEDREAKVETRSKELDGRDAALKKAEAAIALERSGNQELAGELADLRDRANAAIQPINDFIKLFKRTPLAEREPLKPQAGVTKQFVESDATKELMNVMAQVRALEALTGRDGR
jgi:hypothetical protein